MFWESVVIALEGLRANKMRSLLTMLGIIIGVGAVIAMVSIGMGVRDKVEKSIAGLGSNLLIVLPGSTSASGVRMAAGSTTTLTYADAQAIAKEVGGVNMVAPGVQRQYQTVFSGKNWITQMQGTTPDFLSVRNFDMDEGTFITQRNLDSRDRVAVLGKTVTDNLFGDMNPIGQTIRINKSTFRVIGTLAPKGQSAGGQDQDDLIIVPITTAQERMLGITYIQSISVQAASPEVIDQVQQDISALLRTRHRLQSAVDDDFSVRNLTAIMATAAETTGTITLLLGNTAAISLLVGGIGIMNIMLVSVTERTCEIGTRLAIGALEWEVLMQFLVEAVVLSSFGGIIGILLALSSSVLLAHLLQIPFVFNAPIVLVAFLFSAAVGVVFGFFPARKAAQLDPIEALHHE